MCTLVSENIYSYSFCVQNIHALLVFSIFGTVYSLTSCVFLVKSNIQVLRAKFSEITPNSIRRACNTLTEPDSNVSDAVDVRQELDLRIGTVIHLHFTV